MKNKWMITVGCSLFLLAGCLNPEEKTEKPEEPPKTVTESQEESDAAVSAVEAVEGAVVGVGNIQQQTGLTTENVQAGTGSGVIYKKEGNRAFVMTNHHVVEGAKEIEITLANNEKREATLVGSDAYTDLAVLEMNGEGIDKVANLGKSDALEKGETVLAIGNPLGLEFFGSVTKGIISATNRVVPVDINQDGVQDWQVDVLQTDTAINPGNSGGALVNLDGQVVGINSMKISQETVEGIAFVIPIDAAVPVLNELEKNGEIKRPKLGVGLVDLAQVPLSYKEEFLGLPREETEGAVVMQVEPGVAEFERFDVITQLDGEKITNVIGVREILFNKKIGDVVQVTVRRQQEEMAFQIKLRE